MRADRVVDLILEDADLAREIINDAPYPWRAIAQAAGLHEQGNGVFAKREYAGGRNMFWGVGPYGSGIGAEYEDEGTPLVWLHVSCPEFSFTAELNVDNLEAALAKLSALANDYHYSPRYLLSGDFYDLLKRSLAPTTERFLKDYPPEYPDDDVAN